LIEFKLDNRIELTRIQAQHRIQLLQCVRALKAKLVRRMKDRRLIWDQLMALNLIQMPGSSLGDASSQDIMDCKKLELQQEKIKKQIHELTSKSDALQKNNKVALPDLNILQLKVRKIKEEESCTFITVSSSYVL
jgi:hypothetical protein